MKIPEMQVLLPRASEVSRTQQVHLQENNVRQQELAAQMANQTQKAESAVNQASPNEEARIRDRQEREKKREKEEFEEGKTTAEENKRVKPKTSGNGDSIIDILI